MGTLKTLKPGQKGAKGLLKRFGPGLLNVRYRYEEDRGEHLKTVELVVQRRASEGGAECAGSRDSGRVAASSQKRCVRTGVDEAGRQIALRIGWQERELQGRLGRRVVDGIRFGKFGCFGATL